MFTLERAINLNNNVICMFLGKDGERGTESRELHFFPLSRRADSGRGRHQGKDGEHSTECRKVQRRLLLIELFRQEAQ